MARPKGSPNKATAKVAAEIAASGETPLQYMIRIMRDTMAENERRDKMAAAAAPFIHPKLAQTEVSGAGGGPVLVTINKDDAGLL